MRLFFTSCDLNFWNNYLNGQVPRRLTRLEMLELGAHDLVQQRMELAAKVFQVGFKIQWTSPLLLNISKRFTLCL